MWWVGNVHTDRHADALAWNIQENKLGGMCIDGGKMLRWFLRKWNMNLGQALSGL
jgi:hypothetical protein